MGAKGCMISIIVPVFNVEADLFFECIKSIINQSFSNFEVIVVDDGSDKEHAEEIKKVVALDNRINLIRQNHSGVSTARNLAISISQGEYIAFADSDDILEPYFLEESYSVAKKYDADIVIGLVRRTSDMNELIAHKDTPRIEVFHDTGVKKVKPYLLGQSYNTGSKLDRINKGAVSKLIKQNIAKEVKFPVDMKIGEDGIWILDVLNKAGKICIVSQSWYIYRINHKSAICRHNPEIISQVEFYINRIANYIDLSRDSEYLGYVERIYQILRINVYQSFIGHKECKLSKRERNDIISYLYNAEPWIHIKDKRYMKLVDKKGRILALLYKNKLLFAYWDLKRIIQKI